MRAKQRDSECCISKYGLLRKQEWGWDLDPENMVVDDRRQAVLCLNAFLRPPLQIRQTSSDIRVFEL